MKSKNKKCVYIHLTGDIHIKRDKECIIILEFDEMGDISKVEIDGEKREFIESRELYIKNDSV